LETFCKTVDKGEPGDQLGIIFFIFKIEFLETD